MDFWTIFDGFIPLITFVAGAAIGIAFAHEAGRQKGFRDGIRAAREEMEKGWRPAPRGAELKVEELKG